MSEQQTVMFRGRPHQDHHEEASEAHSRLRWRWVAWLAAVVLISWSLSGAQVVADDNVPHPHANCEDPANYTSDGCDLWRSVKASCIYGHHNEWHHHHCCYNEFDNLGSPPVVIVNVKDCHFLAVPTVPVMGVEDADNRDRYPYWTYAWVAAAMPAPYPKEMKKHLRKSIGLAVNPVKHRTQHQLHIHIGWITYDMRDLLSKEYVPHDGSWHPLPKDRVYHKTCSAKFVAGVPHPFKEVSKHFGETNMQHEGIILAGHVENDDDLQGFYIVSCYDACVEKWLNYHCGDH